MSFLEFSKVFVKVYHTKVLHKIRYYGINGSHNQQVVVNGQSSRLTDVLSGVPKGTALWPFFVHNDINEGNSSHMRLFVDDSVI